MVFRDVVVCDLDGCLSDDRWRRNLLPVCGGSYTAYHSQSLGDVAVDDVVIELLHDLRGSDDADAPQRHHLLVVTARPQAFRAQTELWLQNVLPGISCTVLMRPDGCALDSPALKVLLIDRWLNTNMCDESLHEDPWHLVVAAYDDRDDVLAVYPIPKDRKKVRTLPLAKAAEKAPISDTASSVPAILQNMAKTFAERNAVYGSNYKNVAPIIKALWPRGVPSDLVTAEHWHLFELIIVKLTRFANSSLKHTDSIHDAAVYAAMIESIISREEGR